MNGYIKRGAWFVATLLGWAMMTSPAQAASFDCTKASTTVERLICDNPEISKLDEELKAAYKTALQDGKQADAIKKEQKQWMKERNGCMDEDCVKRAYVARLSQLSSFPSKEATQTITLTTEKAKGEKVIQILSGHDAKLQGITYSPEDEQFCNAFLDDFKHQREIEFIEPVLRTDDFNHPELAKLRNQCQRFKGHVPTQCSLSVYPPMLRGKNGMASIEEVKEFCDKQFGSYEYAIYEIDFGDHKEHVIYEKRNPKLYNEELLELLDAPNQPDDLLGPAISNYFIGGEMYSYDFNTCGWRNLKNLAAGGYVSPETYLGLVKYKQSYFSYKLMRLHRNKNEYGLVVGGRNPTCGFQIGEKNLLNKGDTK